MQTETVEIYVGDKDRMWVHIQEPILQLGGGQNGQVLLTLSS